MRRPSGYSHAVVAAAGQTVYLAGQIGTGPDGVIHESGLVEQFDAAARNLVAALAAAGGRPEHIVSLQIFVTDANAYRELRRPIGEAYRRCFGDHYPAISLLEVRRLYEENALVEITGVAVIP
jgi:enamine deaminase RidA (YjgF/YER057c/UK114 family)